MYGSYYHKPVMTKRVLAVDPSLTCSGWALFCVPSRRLLAVGKVRALPPSFALAFRLDDLQRKIASVLEGLALGARDVLVCEGATTMRDPNAALKVEQVRGIFESVARSRSVQVPGRLNPRTVQFEVMGLRGQQLDRRTIKAAALETVRRAYGEALQELGLDLAGRAGARHQDIVDAILLGDLAVSRVHAAHAGSLELSAMFLGKPHRNGGSRGVRRLPR